MIIPVGCHSDFYLDTTQLSGNVSCIWFVLVNVNCYYYVKIPKYPHGDFRWKVQFVTLARVYAE